MSTSKNSTSLKPKKQVKRLQIELSSQELEWVEQLMYKASLIRTKRELVLNAISLFRWAVRERHLGRQIGAIDPKDSTFKELTFPLLDEIEPLVGSKENKD